MATSTVGETSASTPFYSHTRGRGAEGENRNACYLPKTNRLEYSKLSRGGVFKSGAPGPCTLNPQLRTLNPKP